MDNVDINNIRYLQLLIPKLDDNNIENQRQDISEQLLDSMMSGLLEDDSSMELPPSMTGKRSTFSKITDLNEYNAPKKYSCSVCKKTFKDEDSLKHHNNTTGHNKESKTPVKKVNKCLTCGQRFKDEATLSFHCAARGHDNPYENGYTAPKSLNQNTNKSAVRKKPIGKQQKVVLQCSECSRRFKDNKALQFHYVMSGHADDNEEDTDVGFDSEEEKEKEAEDDEEEVKNRNKTKDQKTVSTTKLPCGGCNKRFKDCKSLDLHLALSGHPDKREQGKAQEQKENSQSGKRQSMRRKSEEKVKPESTKRQSPRKKNEKQENMPSEKRETVKRQSGKNQTKSKQSDKVESEINGRTKLRSNSNTKVEQRYPKRSGVILNCSGCRKKFKSKMELDMHCALSGHTPVEDTKSKSTTNNMNNKSSESDSSGEEVETKVTKNGKSQNQVKNQTKAKNSYNSSCFECGKKFKTLEMLNYHEAFSGHVTQEESASHEEKTSEEDEEQEEEEVSGAESDVEDGESVNQEVPDILCSVCSRQFKNKNALYYHMAISGHGASKLGSDRGVKVKPRSRIADLTSSDSSEESDSDDSEESDSSKDEKPPKTSNSKNAKSLSKPRCETCKKQFKDVKTLDYHVALSGHSDGTTKKKRGRPANTKRTETLPKCATLSVNRKRGRQKKVQEIEDEDSEDESSSAEILKDQKRQCKECGRMCKDLYAYEYHCAMTGHGSTAIVALEKIDLSKCKNQLDTDSRENNSSDDGSSDNRRSFKRRRRRKRDTSDDDSDYEGAGTVRSYQSFMEEASVWDKWNPKKGLPCRRCGLLFTKTEDLKRHLLTTSHKTNVFL